MISVNLYAKKQDCLTKYIPFQPITVSDSSVGTSNVNFHLPTLIEEVKQLPKKELKSYKKQIIAFQSAVASFMILKLPLMAKATTVTAPSTSAPVTTLPNSADGIPVEIMELLIGLLKVSVATGIILAAILLVGAGITLMLPKAFRMKDVNDWITDIIKGLVVILTATPLIFLIYYAATKLFSGSGWFVTPF